MPHTSNLTSLLFAKAGEIKRPEDNQQGQSDNDDKGQPASYLVTDTVARTGGVNAPVIDLSKYD